MQLKLPAECQERQDLGLCISDRRVEDARKRMPEGTPIKHETIAECTRGYIQIGPMRVLVYCREEDRATGRILRVQLHCTWPYSYRSVISCCCSAVVGGAKFF